MRFIFYVLMLVSFLVLATSQMYLWRDQVEQWNVMETQIKMLERIIKRQNSTQPYARHQKDL